MREIASAAYWDRCDLSAHGFYKMPEVGGFGSDRPFLYFTFGGAVSEVEVDVLTGDFQILKTDILMDVGKSINPSLDIGQIEGGFMQVSLFLLSSLLLWILTLAFFSLLFFSSRRGLG